MNFASYTTEREEPVKRVPQRHHGGTGSADDDDEVMLNVLRCQLTY